MFTHVYRSFVGFFLFISISLLVFSWSSFEIVHATTTQSSSSIDSELQALLEKDPSTLTESEQTNLFTKIATHGVGEQAPAPAGTVNCFDYYRFGSVQAQLSPTLGQTVPGTPLTFTGVLKNENNYPIVDAQVYAKVFRVTERLGSTTHENGYPLVAFFLVKDRLNMSAQATLPLNFTWRVPKNTEGGDYQIAFFVTSANRFNLLGLTFTDDVTGNTDTFHVTDTSNHPVLLDKNKVLLNGQEFNFAAFPPHYASSEPVTLTTDVVNPSDREKTVTVTWTTSKWDALLLSNEVKRETQTVTLHPKETKKISYTPPVLQTSVTFVSGVLKDKDGESILHVRFVRDGNEEIRLNFPGILRYPLKHGEENTLFSCLHSTNLPVVAGNELTLTLKDDQGNTIHTYTYRGDVTGDMMGIKDTFTPASDLTNFSLTATLFHNKIKVDEVTQYYSCLLLGIPCPEQSPAQKVESEQTFTKLHIAVMAVTGLIMLSILGILLYRNQRRREVADILSVGIQK